MDLYHWKTTQESSRGKPALGISALCQSLERKNESYADESSSTQYSARSPRRPEQLTRLIWW